MVMEKSTPVTNLFSNSAAASLRAVSYHSQPSEIPSGVRQPARRQFTSYKLNGDYERPWIGDKRLKKSRVGNYIIWGFVVVGLALAAFVNFSVAQKVSQHEVTWLKRPFQVECANDICNSIV